MTRKAAELLHGAQKQLRGRIMRCRVLSKQRLHQSSHTLGSQANSVTLSVLLGSSMRCRDHSKQKLHQRGFPLCSQAQSVTLSVLFGSSMRYRDHSKQRLLQREPYSGFPGKVSNFVSLVGQLQDLHGDVLILHTEQLKTGVGGLARLGVPVHLDCYVVPLWVPVNRHLCRRSCLFHNSGHRMKHMIWRLTSVLS